MDACGRPLLKARDIPVWPYVDDIEIYERPENRNQNSEDDLFTKALLLGCSGRGEDQAEDVYGAKKRKRYDIRIGHTPSYLISACHEPS